jgi:hypothetical protein
MTQASVPAPSIRLSSFACPHCGAHATQYWYKLRADQHEDKDPLPFVPTFEDVETIESQLPQIRDEDARKPMEAMARLWKRLTLGEPFLRSNNEPIYRLPILENVFVSRCYTCDALAIWLHDALIYPPTMNGPPPNPDLSDDVRRDYDEARTILPLSPRGAAALLRLAIEKMCIELGAAGADINARIADLVTKGLPPLIQQALDAVRVIGNEAVHPGALDLRDDHDTATKLFSLVNVISDDRISRPKQVQSLYNMIPEAKRKAIETRGAPPKKPT